MIGFLKGKIMGVDVISRTLIVLTGGVGYQVTATVDLLSAAKPEQDIGLFIHTAVREDNIALYGFLKQEELAFFEQLMTVSGVGPKIALEILSAPLGMTQTAIVNEDASMLTKIKGIGRKTAERIIVDLKNKIIPKEMTSVGGANATNGPRQEALLALEGLGYDRLYIMKTLEQLPQEAATTEVVIKYFLKQQSRQ